MIIQTVEAQNSNPILLRIEMVHNALISLEKSLYKVVPKKILDELSQHQTICTTHISMIQTIERDPYTHGKISLYEDTCTCTVIIL